jgi:predicted SnoaL-like aldol condensation-catalyzing enzyme
MESINKTGVILQHHLTAFSENDIDEIMKDYTEASFLCTPDGKLDGLAAIRSFFTEVIKLFPSGKTNLAIKQLIISNDIVYITWTSDSPVAEVPMGSDSFEIKDGKIVWQTLAAHILLKQSK